MERGSKKSKLYRDIRVLGCLAIAAILVIGLGWFVSTGERASAIEKVKEHFQSYGFKYGYLDGTAVFRNLETRHTTSTQYDKVDWPVVFCIIGEVQGKPKLDDSVNPYRPFFAVVGIHREGRSMLMNDPFVFPGAATYDTVSKLLKTKC